MDGILNINKHNGPSSFSIVSQVKRLTAVKKVGHAGTLDPAASGVLPICLGRATRVAEYLQEYPKTYRAEIEFGITTDTYDREGTITAKTDTAGLTLKMIESILPGFQGTISQIPPAYSALKQNGVPLYKLARSGQDITLKSRPVTVYELRVIDWIPPVLTLDITCSKGTYIRSLAYDIGKTTGFGAYMKSLVRRKYGPFDIADSVSLSEFEEAVERNTWEHLVSPPDTVLKHLKPLAISDNNILSITMNGQPLPKDSVTAITGDFHSDRVVQPEDNRYRIYSEKGVFLGIFSYDSETETYKPVKIFPRETDLLP